MRQIIEIAGQQVQINRQKNYRNLTLRVQAPDGQAKISAPIYATTAAIRTFFLANLDKIQSMQAKVVAESKTKTKQYITGEMHYLWGKSYPLQVHESQTQNGVQFDGQTIHLTVKRAATVENRAKLIEAYYRQILKRQILQTAAALEPKMGVHANGFTIRRMKTRWGSCNINKKTISINRLLVEMPLICLESVVAHELVHLLETNHNKRFYRLMDQYYPAWQEANELLKEFSHKVD